jgi:hypothetical protein
MTIIHCIRKERRWLTYCGLSLEHLRSLSCPSLLKSAFGFHQDSGAFSSGTDGEDFDRKCLSCLRSVRVEKKKRILAAVVRAEKRFPKRTEPISKRSK